MIGVAHGPAGAMWGGFTQLDASRHSIVTNWTYPARKWSRGADL